MKSANPFEEGHAAALAGKTFKSCPYDQHSRQFVRWNSGYQSGVIEKRKLDVPQQPQQLALVPEVRHAAR